MSPAFSEMAALQKQICDDGHKLDRKLSSVLGLLSEQHMQSASQRELLQEKVFLIHAMQKQLQETSHKQDKAIESVRLATEQKIDMIQKQMEGRMKEMHDLLHKVLTKLDA